MRKFNKKSIKEKWIKWDQDPDVEILLRPFPASQSMIARTMGGEEIMTINQKIYDYCVMDWKGFVDENDKELKCTEANKKLIFDYDREFVLFVVETITDFDKEIVEEKKISKK